MADVGLYVFGTSILWGQGHVEPKKIYSRIAFWLQDQGTTVRVKNYAHSGAVWKGRDGPGREPLYGEVPDDWPSIASQIKNARGFADKRVCVLVDGGINDVGVFNIVNPLYSRSKLRKRTQQACDRDAFEVLIQLVHSYKGAEIYLLGYYQLLASRPRKSDLKRFLQVFQVCEPRELPADFVARAVENARTFWHDSDRHLASAAQKAHREAVRFNGSVRFVRSGFKASEGLFGKPTLLYKLLERDPKWDDRLVPCTEALLRDRSDLHCFPASTGHPNRLGVLRYVRNLKAEMK